MSRDRNFSLGVVMALSAGVCWGAMAVAAQSLFAGTSGITPMNLVTVRLLVSGLVFLIVSAGASIALIRSAVNVRDVIIAGSLVFGGQFCFMQAISYQGAGPSAIILTTVPFWVAFWQACTQKQLPSMREIVCFVLALAGVSLLVTHGDFESLSFDVKGVTWAFGSAIISAAYSVQPRALLKRAPVTAVMGWAMLCGGIIASFMTPPWTIEFVPTWLNAFELFIVVIMGTIMAFWFYMMAIHLISPVIVGLIGSSEPLSAYLLSVIFLGTVVTVPEMFGAALVLCAVSLVSLGGNKKR
ncbi:MAG: DMT family transporter [Sutterellaceae bacterium]|nr:DMT family transporter [Sutterellaceae bacterium]